MNSVLIRGIWKFDHWCLTKTTIDFDVDDLICRFIDQIESHVAMQFGSDLFFEFWKSITNRNTLISLGWNSELKDGILFSINKVTLIMLLHSLVSLPSFDKPLKIIRNIHKMFI
jgi:hypothetical protein